MKQGLAMLFFYKKAWLCLKKEKITAFSYLIRIPFCNVRDSSTQQTEPRLLQFSNKKVDTKRRKKKKQLEGK